MKRKKRESERLEDSEKKRNKIKKEISNEC